MLDFKTLRADPRIESIGELRNEIFYISLKRGWTFIMNRDQRTRFAYSLEEVAESLAKVRKCYGPFDDDPAATFVGL